MLGGEPGQGPTAEVGEFFDRLLRLGRPFPELGDLFLEPGDLGLARVGDLAGVVKCLDPSFELGAEVSVRASAVERGAVDCGLVGEGLCGLYLGNAST
ncbi:hypothetical protein HRW23_18100 [Streptomyces lunaelactis]|uniref:hypothetical protein n=1 Tax=Streptomyces lunaelactis TaxID=1535768 RepID=UPI001584A345|nr:hypothetical protein [Streptomyces lunaelactis]NUK04410.1 hypothetical protein [Streptomyces lunaelactis]NUK11193.1 hypothetical protein [Streptomyces lunaelactis]NUK19614.1 hypothetical protein [Streptomyces lunaelactis]NUK37567.1 hypothetical protein [Streptomyces lunaelactis]NUK44383.1 hypothetical protein [Streptomyces lunaelactis]